MLHKYLACLIGMILIMIGVGCGKDKNPQETAKNKRVIKQQTGSPLILSLANKKCQDLSGVASLGEPTIYTWDGYNEAKVPYDLSIYSSKNSVHGQGIKETFYHLKEKYIYKIKEVEGQDDESTISFNKETSPGSLLKICEVNAEYPRESLETLTLSVLAHLDKAQNFFKSLEPYESLMPVTLYPMPIIEELIIVDKSDEEISMSETLTDNAAYGNQGEDPAIYIFPQSKEGKERKYFNGIGLWEIPEVMIHEFGHHVFAHYFPYSVKAGIFKIGQHGFWKPPRSKPDSSHLNDQEDSSLLGHHSLLADKVSTATENKRSRKVTHNISLDALNEAFADLFAFYVLNGKETVFSNIRCLSDNRNILSPHFQDGKKKFLNEEILSFYFSEYEEKSGPSNLGCNNYDYQDEHIIGAILAHGINRLLSNQISDFGERAKLLFTWLKRLNSQYATLTTKTSPKGFLNEAIHLVAKIKMETLNENKMNDQDCQILQEVFPKFSFNMCR